MLCFATKSADYTSRQFLVQVTVALSTSRDGACDDSFSYLSVPLLDSQLEINTCQMFLKILAQLAQHPCALPAQEVTKVDLNAACVLTEKSRSILSFENSLVWWPPPGLESLKQ